MTRAERHVPMPLKLVHSDETAGNRGPDECKQALSHQVAQDQSIYPIESRTAQSTISPSAHTLKSSGHRPQWRTKIMRDRGQCNIDNKEVDVEHKQTKAGRHQRQPLGRGALSHTEFSRSMFISLFQKHRRQ